LATIVYSSDRARQTSETGSGSSTRSASARSAVSTSTSVLYESNNSVETRSESNGIR
jgi:hypothetical protein